MATEYDSTKPRRYDLTMSRRTRRSTSFVTCFQDQDVVQQKLHQCQDAEQQTPQSAGDLPRFSLQELIEESHNGEEKVATESHEDNVVAEKVPEAAATGGQKLAMVIKQPEHAGGVKMVGMMRRYVKALNHMIKAKRASKKKNVVPLLMK